MPSWDEIKGDQGQIKRFYRQKFGSLKEIVFFFKCTRAEYKLCSFSKTGINPTLPLIEIHVY